MSQTHSRLFPPLSPTFVTVAAGPTAAAAETLHQQILDAEPLFQNPLLKPTEAVRRAIEWQGAGRPVVLADVQDNPGCGGTSDTVRLLLAFKPAPVLRIAAGVICDAAAASFAHKAGVGTELQLTLGARYGYGSTPLTGTFRVEAVSDGHIVGGGAIQTGITMALGPMAQFRWVDARADFRVIVSSKRYQCFDRNLFRVLGVEPAEQDILALNSTFHFSADFAPMAAAVFMVEAPGAAPCRLTGIPYRKLRPGVRLGPDV